MLLPGVPPVLLSAPRAGSRHKAWEGEDQMPPWDVKGREPRSAGSSGLQRPQDPVEVVIRLVLA